MIKNINTPGKVYGIALSSDENYAFVADYDKGLQIIDVSNPMDTKIIKSINIPAKVTKVLAPEDGNYLFVMGYYQENGDKYMLTDTFDLAVPYNPKLMRRVGFSIPGGFGMSSPSFSVSIYVEDDGNLQFSYKSGSNNTQIVINTNLYTPDYTEVPFKGGHYTLVVDGSNSIKIKDLYLFN